MDYMPDPLYSNVHVAWQANTIPNITISFILLQKFIIKTSSVSTYYTLLHSKNLTDDILLLSLVAKHMQGKYFISFNIL